MKRSSSIQKSAATAATTASPSKPMTRSTKTDSTGRNFLPVAFAT